MHSMLKLVGPIDTMSRLFEIYITIFARLIVTHMPPERIAITLNMRYSDVLSTEQQYILIAFTEAHINGMNQGFYIQSDSDVEKVKEIAVMCQKSAGDMLDYFILTVNENAQEKKIELYIDGYGDAPCLIAPQGFHLK